MQANQWTKLLNFRTLGHTLIGIYILIHRKQNEPDGQPIGFSSGHLELHGCGYKVHKKLAFLYLLSFTFVYLQLIAYSTKAYG